MQNLTKLLEKYSQDSRILKLASLLTASAPQAITLEGLAGSSVAFVIAGSWMSNPRQMVIIANNQEEAAYMFNNLDNIFTLTKVHYLPDSFKKPGNFDQISSTQVLQRTEVVNYISESDHDQSIIITYPEA
ncbi:MAG TPA: transcription-repair coupling factor, partial [Saprospiraceae bacterium]|nr:transcription-repair coupling factor [Saprospiraceae bacterium]